MEFLLAATTFPVFPVVGTLPFESGAAEAAGEAGVAGWTAVLDWPAFALRHAGTWAAALLERIFLDSGCLE